MENTKNLGSLITLYKKRSFAYLILTAVLLSIVTVLSLKNIESNSKLETQYKERMELDSKRDSTTQELFRLYKLVNEKDSIIKELEKILHKAHNIVKKPVSKNIYIELKENQKCTNEDCLGLENIQKIEIVSFVLEKRKARGNWESFGETHTSKELIDKLEFGNWHNPECDNADEGKSKGTGWHFPAGSCGSGRGNKFTAVEKVTVKVTYMGQ